MLRKGSGFSLVQRRDMATGKTPGLLRETVIARTHPADTRSVTVTLKAYHGAAIDQALAAFLRAAAGESSADLVIWMGHDRLMDVASAPVVRASGTRKVPAIVLACESEQYFGPVLRELDVPMVAMTRTFMAPEAYLLEAVLEAVRGHGVLARAAVREALVSAYAKYQKLSLRAAGSVFAKL